MPPRRNKTITENKDVHGAEPDPGARLPTPNLAVCQSKSPPRSRRDKTVHSPSPSPRLRFFFFFFFRDGGVRNVSARLGIISSGLPREKKKKETKKHNNNLKEIPTTGRANLRAVSQSEWQPPFAQRNCNKLGFLIRPRHWRHDA